MSEENTQISNGLPEGIHLSLSEAQTPAPDGTIGIQVQVNTIMDQIHQHWARQMADQIQRNAELAAALTAVSEELEEAKGKLAALTAVSEELAETKGKLAARKIQDAVEENLMEDFA